MKGRPSDWRHLTSRLSGSISLIRTILVLFVQESAPSVMIRLSKLADYGIVIMTQLARNAVSTDRSPQSAHRLADETSIPQPMASKILKLLAQADLATSRRGASGGYELARGAEAITMADIIEALDGPIAITECVDDVGAGCGIELLCPARTNWQRINGAIREALHGISLDEMTGQIPEAFLLGREREARMALLK